MIYLLLDMNLLLKILELTLEIPDIRLDDLNRITELDFEQLFAILGRQGYLREDSNEVKLDSNFRINLAIFGIVNLNIEPFQVLKYLSWQEFEEFCLYVLEMHEYCCIKNFRFSKIKKRFEIDILGFCNPYVLSIDAKQWRTRHGKMGALKNAVEKQIDRTKALLDILSKYQEKLPLYNWKRALFVPILITSMNEGIKQHLGVPIIPFYQFNNFIANIYKNIEDLTQFKIRIKKKGV